MIKKKNNSKANVDNIKEKLKKIYSTTDYGNLDSVYDKNIKKIKSVFEGDDQIIYRELKTGKNIQIHTTIISCDVLVNSETINNYIIRPLMECKNIGKETINSEYLLSNVFQLLNVKKSSDLNEIIQAISSGDALVLVDGVKEGLLFDVKGFLTRAISEPEGEKILSGPREGFTESIMTNLSLLRRKLCSEKLKVQYYKIGDKTSTNISIVFLDDIVNTGVLTELYKRLEEINIDSILDANYINELIRDNKLSPFRSVGYSERPDIIAAKLLEGRIAIFVDGTPVVLSLPYLFIENFQSNEDYYLNSYYTSFSRLLRMLGFLITTSLPAIYTAIVSYHPEVLPATLLISVAGELQSVSIPAAIEAFIMIIVFEILRETALRVQTNVGQALSIVGALVIGQSAVEAKLVAAHMVIVIAMSGITSLIIPRLNAASLFIRFINLLFASFFGLFGVAICFSLFLIHLLSMKSFGVWQIDLGSELNFQNNKDSFMRVPWHQMLKRPVSITKNAVRQKPFTED